MPKQKKVHYIDNELFCKVLVEYLDKCKDAKKEGKEEPPIPNYIGECFLKIATNVARAPNFCNYSFKEEMIMDGVENCLQYFRNFNPIKSKNPFSYFTQIVWFAFVRRIGKEKKQAYIKYKLTEQFATLDTMELNDTEDGRSAKPTELYENISEYIQTYEEKAETKKAKRRKGKLEKQLPENNAAE